MQPSLSHPRQCAVAMLFAVPFLLAVALPAQSETERGEDAWKNGSRLAIQGHADSSLAAFRQARTIAEALHDSTLLAASLRAEAEVFGVYRGCRDSSLALLRQAQSVSIQGDRGAGLTLIRQLATAGKLDEARAVHAALYADIRDQVPRSISRESIGYLSALASIQQAAGQPSAALSSLRSARSIADRLASGDVVDSAKAHPLTEINSLNYWVTFELAQLMLASGARGVSNPANGKLLMNAVAQATDEPEEGNERRFSTFRLADRLKVNAWRCELNGGKCPVPPPAKC